jgi:outer membrane protein insertion porin family
MGGFFPITGSSTSHPQLFPLPSLFMTHGILSCSRLALYGTLLSVLWVGAPLPSAQAQDLGLRSTPTNAPIVRDVQVVFKGAVTMDESRVKSQMATRVGQPYLDETVERDIRSLYGTGAVENLDIQAQDMGGNGVRVMVIITGRGAIGEIDFLGNTVFGTDTLKKEIKPRVGDPVDEIKLAAAQTAIHEMYEKKGYRM